MVFILLSLLLMGDPGGGASRGARPPPLKIKINSCMVLFPSLLGHFLYVEGLFSPFGGHFLHWGGGGGGEWENFFSFYVKIYLEFLRSSMLSLPEYSSFTF